MKFPIVLPPSLNVTNRKQGLVKKSPFDSLSCSIGGIHRWVFRSTDKWALGIVLLLLSLGQLDAQNLTVNGDLAVNGKARQGSSSINSGSLAFAIGFDARALGLQSFAIGSLSRANSAGSMTFGPRAVSSGEGGVAIGLDSFTALDAYGSVAIGQGMSSNHWSNTVIGRWNHKMANVSTNTPVFIVGNGDSDTERSNAMVIRTNGDTGIGTNNPTAKLHVAGSAKFEGELSVVNAKIRIAPSGDLSMGTFTSGTAPQ